MHKLEFGLIISLSSNRSSGSNSIPLYMFFITDYPIMVFVSHSWRE